MKKRKPIDRHNIGAAKSVLLAHYILVTFLVLGYSACVILNLPLDSSVYWLCVLGTLVCLWNIVSWSVARPGLMNPYGLFLLAATVFSAGQVMLEPFGLNERGLLGGKFPADILAYTVSLVTVSLALMHLGALTGFWFSQGRHLRVRLNPDAVGLRRAALLCLAIAIVPASLTTYAALRTVLAQGYGGLYGTESPTGFAAASRVLSAFLIPGSMLLLASSRQSAIGRYASLMVICTYTLPQLLMGLRGWSLLPLLAYAWLWHRTIAPLQFRRWGVVAAAFLIFVIPTIRATRGRQGKERMSFQTMQEAFSSVNNPLTAAISEMGGSMSTIAYTVQLVPSERGYDFGLGYAYAASTLMPNLFWDVHPAIARGNYSDWLIRRVDPWIAERGGGLGYSFIAESYINFGSIGGPLLLMAFGFTFVYFVTLIERKDIPGILVLVAIFLPSLLFATRGESYFIARAVVWQGILPIWVASVLRGRIPEDRHQLAHTQPLSSAA